MSELSAQIGAGASKGFADAMDYQLERPMRKERIAEAKAKRELAELELGDYKKAGPLRDAKLEKELADTRAAALKANTTLLEQQSYEAFRKYDASGDVRHLNTFLTAAKNDPVGGSVYGDFIRVDGLNDIGSSERERLMNQAGIASSDEFLKDYDLVKDLVVATTNSGERVLVQMSKLKAMTRFNDYAMEEEIKRQENVLKKLDLLAGPQTDDTRDIRALANVLREAGDPDPLNTAISTYMSRKNKEPGKGGGTMVERTAELILDQNPKMDPLEALRQATLLHAVGSKDEREAERMAKRMGISYDEAFNRVTARTERTSTMKNADEAANIEARLDSLAPKGKTFFDIPMSDPVMRRQAGRYVRELEQVSGNPMTTEDKRVARDIRDLITLGETAGAELSESATGLVDSLLGDAKKYMMDEGGNKGTAAYETFRNIFRNALYGASLTQAETAAFNTAAGTSKQKLGPVLEQLNVQMSSLKNQLSAIYDMNNEYVAYYYLGMDLDQVDRAIRAIDQRIDMVKNRIGTSRATEKAPDIKPAPTPLSPEEEAKVLQDLDSKLKAGGK